MPPMEATDFKLKLNRLENEKLRLEYFRTLSAIKANTMVATVTAAVISAIPFLFSDARDLVNAIVSFCVFSFGFAAIIQLPKLINIARRIVISLNEIAVNSGDLSSTRDLNSISSIFLSSAIYRVLFLLNVIPLFYAMLRPMEAIWLSTPR